MTNQNETEPYHFRACVQDLKDEIPTSWEYSWYQNDACPSYTCKGLHIFIDHPEPTMREYKTWKRFYVGKIDDQEPVMETDSFDDLLKFVKEY
jgi:hypothetical protein